MFATRVGDSMLFRHLELSCLVGELSFAWLDRKLPGSCVALWKTLNEGFRLAASLLDGDSIEKSRNLLKAQF